MKIINKKIDYNYDVLAGALSIFVGNSSDYEEAIELDSNTFLAIDENNYPNALEILDASSVLNTKKFSLKRIKSINLKICDT